MTLRPNGAAASTCPSPELGALRIWAALETHTGAPGPGSIPESPGWEGTSEASGPALPRAVPALGNRGALSQRLLSGSPSAGWEDKPRWEPVCPVQELAPAWAGGLCSVGPRVSSFVRAGEQVAVGCHLREEDASVMNDHRAERERIRTRGTGTLALVPQAALWTPLPAADTDVPSPGTPGDPTPSLPAPLLQTLPVPSHFCRRICSNQRRFRLALDSRD